MWQWIRQLTILISCIVMPSRWNSRQLCGRECGCWCPLAAATASGRASCSAENRFKAWKNSSRWSRYWTASRVLSPELLRLVSFLKETTFCSYFDAVKAILPGGIGYRMRYDYGLSPLWNGEEKALEEDERKLVSYLENKKGMVPEEKLLGLLGLSTESTLLGQMLQKGILVREETAKRRMKDETVRMLALSLPEKGLEGIRLTPKQKEVLNFLQTVETASVRETVYFTGVTEAVFRTLQNKGLLYYYDAEIFRQAPDQEAAQKSCLL